MSKSSFFIDMAYVLSPDKEQDIFRAIILDAKINPHKVHPLLVETIKVLDNVNFHNEQDYNNAVVNTFNSKRVKHTSNWIWKHTANNK